MPNVIKYSTIAQTEALRSGNFHLGVGDVSKGETSTTGYWNGYSPRPPGYTIYLNKESNGPSIYFVNFESQLVDLTNIIKGGAPFTNSLQCFNWFASQSDKMLVNKNYPPIITTNLLLNIDCSFSPSYTQSGNTIYDLGSLQKNGTLNNITTNSNYLEFNGTTSDVTFPPITQLETLTDFSVEFIYTTGVDRVCLSNLVTDQFDVNTGFEIYTNNGGYLVFTIPVGPNDYKDTVTITNISNLIPTHVVCVSQNNQKPKIYLNGELNVEGGTTINQREFTSTLKIGEGYYNGNLNGQFFLLRIYDKVLTPSEILNNFYQGSVITNGVVLFLDASNTVSFWGSNTWQDLVSDSYSLLDSFGFGTNYIQIFDGYVLADSTNKFNYTGTTTLSVETWIQIDALDQEIILGGRYFDLAVDSRNVSYGIWIGLGYYGFAVGTQIAGSNSTSELTTWTHLVGVLDSSKLKLYKNGELLAEVNRSQNPSYINSDFIIVSYPFFTSNKIGLLKLYDRDLSASEVAACYQSTKYKYGG